MLNLARFLPIGAALAALLAGCASPLTSIGGHGEMPQARTLTHQLSPASLRHTDLLYVADVPYVEVFSFPDGKQLQQIYENYPFGLCVNRQGDVFAVDMVADEVFVYGHGSSTPKATLSYPGYNPTQCAADPKTGNVAVISGAGAAPKRGSLYYNVWVYRDGKGTPTNYQLSSMSYIDYAAYDDSGDLFIDGESDGTYSPRTIAFAELPYRKNAFEMIKPDQAILNRIRGFSAIQWTGKELAIGNYTGYPRASVDRIRIEGSKAIFAHGTNLRESQGISVFWIENGIVVVPQNSGVADLWHFPGGGKPFGAISVFATGGVVVSPGRK